MLQIYGRRKGGIKIKDREQTLVSVLKVPVNMYVSGTELPISTEFEDLEKQKLDNSC